MTELISLCLGFRMHVIVFIGLRGDVVGDLEAFKILCMQPVHQQGLLYKINQSKVQGELTETAH